jgi:hypothetical protein
MFRSASLQLLKYDSHEALPVTSFPLSLLPAAKPSIDCFEVRHSCRLLTCGLFIIPNLLLIRTYILIIDH